jgi:hypothetical protein
MEKHELYTPEATAFGIFLGLSSADRSELSRFCNLFLSKLVGFRKV